MSLNMFFSLGRHIWRAWCIYHITCKSSDRFLREGFKGMNERGWNSLSKLFQPVVGTYAAYGITAALASKLVPPSLRSMKSVISPSTGISASSHFSANARDLKVSYFSTNARAEYKVINIAIWSYSFQRRIKKDD